MALTRIDQAIRFFLCVLIFWLPYSNAVVESSVITCLLLWAMKRGIIFFSRDPSPSLQKKGVREFIAAFRPKSSFLNAPIAFFILACVFTTVGSTLAEWSLYGLITKTLEWFFIYFLVVEIATTRRYIFIILSIFIFTSFATSVDGLIQFYITHRDFFGGRVIVPQNGATAAFNTYNDLGGYLTIVVPLALSLFFFVKNKWMKVLVFSIFITCAWCLVVTLARGAWLAGCLGILFFLFFYGRKLFTVALGMLILFAICFSILVSPEVKGEYRIDTTNMSWRLGVWQYSMKMFKDRPIFGYGINTYMKMFKEYRIKNGGYPDSKPAYAHNCYIQMAVETGIVGLVFFLWILGRLFREILGQIREWNPINGDLKFLLAGLLSANLGFLAHSFVDTNFYSLKLSALYWFMTGLAVSVSQLLKADVK